MGWLLRNLANLPFMKPLMRFLLGAIAIPIFRWFLRYVIRLRDMDAELEKDLEQWFRGTLLLLVATRNMETFLFDWLSKNDADGGLFNNPWVAAGRLMLAIGVTEVMPDQALFTIIHANPPPRKKSTLHGWPRWRDQIFWAGKGILCKHLDRSSQVLAIMCAIFPGWVGWACFGLASIQYLIIGLVTSRDKAMDVLSEFDKQVEMQRQWLIDELRLEDKWQPQDLVDEWYPPRK
jgi:hypothetical protein